MYESNSNQRILLVDDEPGIIRTLSKYMKSFGYDYDSTEDGILALEQLQKQEYAVGIFDIMMPRLDGIELLARAKDIEPDIEVIMITGAVEIGMVIEALKLGAFSFLRKPFNIEDIMKEVRNAIDHRRLKIDNRNYSKNLRKLVEQRTSELKASEAALRLEKEKLQNALESIKTGLQVVAKDGSVLWSNRIAEVWFGKISNWDQFMVSSLDEVLVGSCDTCQVFNTGRSRKRNFTLKCKDDVIREFEMICSPVHDKSGMIIQAVSLIQDVTERNRLERQLLHSERLASMGEIAAGLAHEINNPIMVILGLVQNMMADVDSNHEFFEDFRIIESETFRTSRVIKSLLEFAHEPAAVFSEISLVDVCRSSLEFLDYKFKENRIKIIFNPPDNYPMCNADPDQLMQVLVNLLLNSLHSIENDGEIEFKFDVEKSMSPNETDYLRLDIIDTGKGISQDDLTEIFKPFFTRKGTKGTGLGLSISRRIIEGHGGIITINSKLNEGTTCTIKIPM